MVIRNKTATRFDLFLEQTGGVQNLRVHVYAMSSLPTANMSNATPAVTWVSGFVTGNTGSLSLENLQVRPTLTGSGFQLASVSGTFSANVSGWCTYGLNTDAHYASSRASVAVTSSFAHPFGWSGTTAQGNEIRLTVVDRTSSKAYRVTSMLESGTNGCFVSIEKLV